LAKTKFIALVKQNGGKKPKQGLRFCTVWCRDKEVVNQSTHENVSSSKNRRYSSWPTFYTQKYGFVIFTNIIVYEKLEPVGNYKPHMEIGTVIGAFFCVEDFTLW